MLRRFKKLIGFQPDWHVGQLAVVLVLALPLTILLGRAVPSWIDLDAFTVLYDPRPYEALENMGVNIDRPSLPPWKMVVAWFGIIVFSGAALASAIITVVVPVRYFRLGHGEARD